MDLMGYTGDISGFIGEILLINSELTNKNWDFMEFIFDHNFNLPRYERNLQFT